MRLLEPQPGLPLLTDLTADDAAAEVGTDASLEAIAPHLSRLRLLAVRFPVFKDGRGFSLAAGLRSRGYTGELVALGDLLPDQAQLLARSGFDAVEPSKGTQEEWTRSLGAFSASYQPAADGAPHVWALRAAAGGRRAAAAETIEDRAARLNAELRGASAQAVLETAIRREFPGGLAVLSSFGAEAAVTLHLVAEIDPATPVLFLETGHHFAQTLQHRDELVQTLKLSDVRVLRPVGAAEADPANDLWRRDPDRCCSMRKVVPLAQAAGAFTALVTGRKHIHGGERVRLPVFEVAEGQIKVNPLASWTREDIEAYYAAHALPRHPLVEHGFPSIGCWPCTRPADGPDLREGRWAGSEKRECGIHLPSRWAAGPLEKKAS